MFINFIIEITFMTSFSVSVYSPIASMTLLLLLNVCKAEVER